MDQDFRNLNRKPKYFSKDDIVQGPKKFVFQLYPENAKYIESLSYQEKQDLVNGLITRHIGEKRGEQKKEDLAGWIKKVVIASLLILVGIPLLLYLANVSLHFTKNSYSDMQNNFEKLF